MSEIILYKTVFKPEAGIIMPPESKERVAVNRLMDSYRNGGLTKDSPFEVKYRQVEIGDEENIHSLMLGKVSSAIKPKKGWGMGTSPERELERLVQEVQLLNTALKLGKDVLIYHVLIESNPSSRNSRIQTDLERFGYSQLEVDGSYLTWLEKHEVDIKTLLDRTEKIPDLEGTTKALQILEVLLMGK